jgi:RNA recognition motif-containing protein
VIRDKKTGDSLQYSFVEFDDKDACEKAYFKMDNVLIDDRRIHVDFSQSVSQYKWKGKGRLEIVDKNKPTDQKNHNEKGKINTTGKYKFTPLTPEGGGSKNYNYFYVCSINTINVWNHIFFSALAC